MLVTITPRPGERPEIRREAPAREPVPDMVPMGALRRILFRRGVLERVNAAVAEIGGEAAIQWEYETHVLRHSPLVLAVAAMLELTAEQMDAIAREAEALG